MSTNKGPVTEAKIKEVMDTCRRFGGRSIIALSGVPGTGKSYIAKIAAQRLAGEKLTDSTPAGEPLMVREVQFHPTYSYEEFIEGYRANLTGGFSVQSGAFLNWNDLARDEPERRYVLLIEELTRANLPAVLGELMTYLEYRDHDFYTLYGRRPVKIAKNLLIMATYNPRDRSALEMDDALLRRLRIIDCPPDTGQLLEMLKDSKLSESAKARLVQLFETCRREHADEYATFMPFGHGVFADVVHEQPDLSLLWQQRLAHMLRPPGRQPHPFTETIEAAYPWRDPGYAEPGSAGGGPNT